MTIKRNEKEINSFKMLYDVDVYEFQSYWLGLLFGLNIIRDISFLAHVQKKSKNKTKDNLLLSFIINNNNVIARFVHA